MPSPFSVNDIEELYFVAHNTWRIVPEQVVHLCAKLFPLLSAGRVHNCEKISLAFPVTTKVATVVLWPPYQYYCFTIWQLLAR